jgi:hypothetical protein
LTLFAPIADDAVVALLFVPERQVLLQSACALVAVRVLDD